MIRCDNRHCSFIDLYGYRFCDISYLQVKNDASLNCSERVAKTVGFKTVSHQWNAQYRRKCRVGKDTSYSWLCVNPACRPKHVQLVLSRLGFVDQRAWSKCFSGFLLPFVRNSYCGSDLSCYVYTPNFSIGCGNSTSLRPLCSNWLNVHLHSKHPTALHLFWNKS